ncbi:MAG: exodeoxyribonuclease III [Flavobacteriaceae bacterium]|nr:exodeoxyribonuclease III [Flavobacteriaceae bacterium]
MKIISYNVNGIRAAMNKGFMSWATTVEPDILCIQEIKAFEKQVNLTPIEDEGYYHFWNSAERAGYSGVAIFSKKQPNQVIYGTGNPIMDGEGRVIRADFDQFSLISLYIPSATNINRLEFKLAFCHAFSNYIYELRKEIPNLIICGDYNICHQPIDIHDPIRLKNVSGFLPIEREWLSHYINYCGLVDSFRHFNQEPENYTWWSYRAGARDRNKGWRLDYHMVSDSLMPHVRRSVHLPEAKHSDHCPILLELDF